MVGIFTLLGKFEHVQDNYGLKKEKAMNKGIIVQMIPLMYFCIESINLSYLRIIIFFLNDNYFNT